MSAIRTAGLVAAIGWVCCACGGASGGAADTGGRDTTADGGDAAARDTTPDDTGPPPAVVRLRVTTPEGETPARYRLIVAPDGGAPLAVTCPDGAGAREDDDEGGGAPLRCTADGAVLDVTAAGDLLAVTVKAPSYRWLEATATPSFADDTIPLALAPLAPFEATPDYRTGIAADDGVAAFEALAYPADTELGPALLVKFYARGFDGDDPSVWLQNTRRHPIHYEFARGVLGIAESRAEFEANTYMGDPRPAIAGTIVHYPQLTATSAALGGPIRAPFALTFFPSDGLTPAQALRAHRLIEERLGCAALDGGERRLVYLPAGSTQTEQLAAERATFDARDALWTTHAELYEDVTQQLLNEGVAYGTLRRMSPEELAGAVVSFQDVLVLTRLPNELPIVGGTITEELQTPLAHVNVAARTRGTPNLALLGASEDDRVAPLLGELVRFEVTDGGFTLAATTLAEAQAFWDGQGREPFVPDADLERDGLPGFDALGFADAIAVGVKAANLAELSRLLPDGAPDGFAVPFRHYDAFLRTATVTAAACAAAWDDCTEERRSPALCDRAQALCLPPGGGAEPIADHVARLLADAEFRSDSPLREACLDNVRHHLRHAPLEPGFAAQLDARVQGRFGVTPVRLRSSTNAEDLEGFSGAGLYSSYTAHIDEPGDEPSAEIRKVWASVWNWRAFEERSFWNIDHLAVKMGVAVHPSFPDEAANGVLITQNIADPLVAGMYVNVQRGEVPVTNPEDGALPEVFSIVPAPVGSGALVQVVRQRWSSLSPGTPILTDGEIQALYAAARTVQQHFAPLYGADPDTLALDLEFKLDGPDRALVVKQVRPYTVAH